MQIPKKYFKAPMQRIIQVLHNSSIQSPMLLDKIIIIVHFFQVLSFFFRLDEVKFRSNSANTLKSILIYMNLAELIEIFQSVRLNQVVYILSGLIMCSPILIFCYFFVFYQLRSQSQMSLYLRILVTFFQWTLYLIHWVFLIPLLSIFMWVFREELLLGNDSFICKIFSFMEVGFSIILVYFEVWLQRSVLFLDDSKLIVHVNIYESISLLLRVLIVILQPFYKSMEILYHILLHGFLINWIFASSREMHIRNTELCKFFVSMLYLSEFLAINFSAFSLLGLFSEESLFYLSVLMGLLAFKFGGKVFEYHYSSIISSPFSFNSKSMYYLEELYHQSEFGVNESDLLLVGILKLHLMNCEDETCSYLCKHYLNKGLLHEKASYIANKLIIRKFTGLMIRNVKNLKNLVVLLVKFMSFLSISNVNVVKSYFEIQRIVTSSKIEEVSFFHDLVFETLRKKLKQKIRNIKTASWAETSNGSGNRSGDPRETRISPEDFFKITKTQNGFEKHLKDLVIHKKLFWEAYEKGLTSTEELIHLGTSLSKNLEHFLKILTPAKGTPTTSPVYLLRIKYLSIFHSILFNNINQAMKYEEEYEGIVLKNQGHESNLFLRNLSFLDPDIATCLVSYLKFEGELKEEYKTEKLASFFGYSSLEFRAVRSLTPLMPLHVAKHHNAFVNTFLRKSKKALKESSLVIDSFALNKREFIFPVRMFLGYNFDYKDDFVLMAALMKTEETEVMNLLCDENGNTIGVSESILGFLKKHHSFLDKRELNYFNILKLCPEIESFVEEYIQDNARNSDFVNQIGWLSLPEKLKELMNYIAAIKKEESEQKKNVDYTQNSQTIKTIKSNKTDMNSHRSAAFKLPKMLATLSSTYEQLFHGCENAQDYKSRVYSIFLTTAQVKRFLMSFDLHIRTHKFGPGIDDKIMVIQVKIRRLESENETISRKQDTHTHTQTRTDDFFIRRNVDSTSKLNETSLSNDFRGLEALLPIENEVRIANFLGRTQIDNSMELPIPPSCEDRTGKREPVINEKPDFRMKKTESPGLRENLTQTIKTPMLAKNEDVLVNRLDISNSDNNEREGVNRERGKKTQRSSSVIENKTSHLIFNALENIQKDPPKELGRITSALLFEAVMIAVFFVVLFALYADYVSQSYEPTQKSMINYCRIATSLSYATSMFTEVEYQTFNLTNRTLTPQKLKIWRKIMTDDYNTMKEINFAERNMPGNINYQNVYKTVQNLFIDPSTLNVKTENYADSLDFITNLLYSKINFTEVIPNNEIITLQRNYPYLLPATSTILLSVQNDFNQSNTGTTNTALNVMIVFLIASMIFKLFVTIQLLDFHKKIGQIINIFRRVNLQDSFNERNFFQEIMVILQQPFLRFSFTEKALNKRVLVLDDGHFGGFYSGPKSDKKSVTDRRKPKIRTKSGFYNIKPLPVTRIIILMSILTTWGTVYYFFNYYFWVSNNQNIDNLIKINIFFINVYIYSTSIFGFNTMALRERISVDLEYESINNSEQKHSIRMEYFYVNLLKRLYLIGNITAQSLPQYTLAAKNSIQSAEFNQLVDRNICDLLTERGFIEDEDEHFFCEGSFNGAFMRGILNLVNDFILQIKYFQMYVEVKNTQEEDAEQTKEIKALINTQEYEDFMFSYYYYHHTLLLYYDYINGYYKGLMDEEMNKLYSFLISTSVASVIITVFLAILLKKKLEKYYKFIALMLNLIPQEKLMNDEQTKFLINGFMKKM